MASRDRLTGALDAKATSMATAIVQVERSFIVMSKSLVVLAEIIVRSLA